MISKTLLSRRSLFIVLLLIVSLSALYLVRTAAIPQDSPTARMFRSEANLTVLAGAVEMYRERHQAYPPAGREGLERAAELFSGSSDYLPGGAPLDGWGRAFVYVPHGEYANAGALALGEDGAFSAPEIFQLYSMGADGKSGLEDPAGRQDNINHWDASKPWRAIYSNL